MAILPDVGTTTIKATYSLDEETVRELERLAERLGVSKSEALRMAVHRLARVDLAPGRLETAALDELEAHLGLTEDAAEEWVERVRRERIASERV